MATAEILSSYIVKLNHPLREIRERALKLLTAKLKLGYQLEDELSGTRQLLESLLAWFHVQQPSLQREALDLLLAILKTKSGTYISKEFGIRNILSSLDKVKDKIDADVLERYDDVIDTLKFMNTVQSEDNIAVPRLALPTETSSESESGSNSGFYNLGPNFQSSKETSISNEDIDYNRHDMSKNTDGIKVLLFPWVDLCSSDSKTMLLIEDALRLFKSTRRCCRFIRDVFLRDFPAEIFLNRPVIIKSLLAISEGVNGGRPGESLQVLLYITRALCKRLAQLTSIDLIHEASRICVESRESEDCMTLELEHLTSGSGLLEPQQPRQEDGLAALRQLAAPLYALDTLHSVLSIMARSVAFVDPVENEVLNMRELNTCVSLVEWLITLLLECVSEIFWNSDHTSKTHRDIGHKSCMVMRLLGDLLMKYRKSFTDDSEKCHHRVAWLRLLCCAERLLNWARNSALPPSSLVAALQSAHLDPALQILYPELDKKISYLLQNAKTSIDQEYKSKYRELTKLFACMEDAVTFMKNKKSCRSSKGVLRCIKKSLPVLEIHMSESYLNDVCDILLNKIKSFDLDDNDWSVARSVTLNLMAHNEEWVRVKFYSRMADMVKAVLVSEANQIENEKCLTLLCDVGVLTEICCHGLSSESKKVESAASETMLYLLRGRMVLSESCWWRLLASLLPVLPLVHVFAAHDTPLGQAIWKSLESDIAQCMGVPATDVTWGLTRMLFVQCVAIQLEAAHSLCCLLDDDRYLPPKETLRADILLNALRRIEPQDFNIDFSSSPSKKTQTTGLLQILDVLKQDITLDEDGIEMIGRATITPALEPSLRRSTLQQLAVMMRQQEFHEAFIQSDGLRVIMAILRMSMTVDDYLAFPECAISCVSILNSVCFVGRHTLLKVPDLVTLLLRVILVFPANESAVLLSTQVLALVAWSGFALQELDSARRKVPALPFSVTSRTSLPFNCNTYWHTSPNAEHSSVEWLLSGEEWRAALRVGWWCAFSGAVGLFRGAAPPPAPLALRPAPRDVSALQSACPAYCAAAALTALENATTHSQVRNSLDVLESYVHLLSSSSLSTGEFAALPWQHMRRFLSAPPASSRDTALLIALMQFILAYMDNVPNDGTTMSWIKSYFIGNDSVLSLLSRDQLHPHQTPQEDIEVTQLHIHIVKIVLRCIIILENEHYDSSNMESLLKILLACLDKVDLKNFHMLGYLNELMRCIRYALNSRHCKLSEDTLLQCLKLMTRTLSGCASGAGRKGQACRLDALMSLLALLKQVHEELLPVQRWSECWNSDVVRAVSKCSRGACPQLRAASLQVIAALAHHAQLMPQLMQAISEESLSQFACRIFAERHEANIVRSSAAQLLAAIAARASPHCDVLELDVLEQLKENSFVENALDILIDFCNEKEYTSHLEPNVPLLVLERRSELEVRAQKCSETHVSPSTTFQGCPPPTAELVVAVADVIHNTQAFPHCPVQAWNDQGLYRLMFRCASWSSGSPRAVNSSRSASCRALVAAASHKCVRALLAGTKDCLYNLLATLTPLEEDEQDSSYLEARCQGLLLLALLIGERSASDGIWRELRAKRSLSFFSLLLQTLEHEEVDLQTAGLYCLSQVAFSTTHKRHPDKSKTDEWVEFYDNLKSPFGNEDYSSARYAAGDGHDCQPEYMAEELCKAVITLYQKSSLDMKKYQSNQDDIWVRVCSCLSLLMSVSPRSRLYGVHRQLPRMLLAHLQGIRDHLSVQGKPVDVIKNANHNPVLRTLYWLLTVIDCLMMRCHAAKEAFAEDNLAVSLSRLWPWCMMTDQLRLAVTHLLLTFTNDCPKAWSCLSSCVGGRSLVGEVASLASREAAQQSRTRADTLLLNCVHTLRHCLRHHQCRTILLKSDVLSSLYKLSIRERCRSVGGSGSSAAGAWAKLCEAAARQADGAAALLALRPQMSLLPPALRSCLVPALAHAAVHQRITFLQSSDLLELLSGTLLAGEPGEVVAAARAAWALAANNHKAKLQLRSAGVAAALHSAMQRMHRVGDERALQLLTYANTVLQAT